MEKSWLKSYPKEVPFEINQSEYNNIMDVFDESCRKFKDKLAFTNMGHSITFEEFDQQVGNFASFLQNELKLNKGDRLAIQMPNLLQFPICVFGALRAGLIIVNTNPLYTAAEMEHQFKDSGAKAIIILANYAHLLEKILTKTSIQSVVITEVADLLPAPKKWLINLAVKYIKNMVPKYKIENSYRFNEALTLGALNPYNSVSLAPSDIAFLQYTGGTTGISKGAMLSHKNIISNMLQICVWMKPKLIEGEEVIITPLPMYHIFSLTLNCLSFMKYGGQNVLITNPRDIPAFIKELKKYPFTVLSGVNTLFNALMNHPEFMTINFSRLKISVAGAMALQKSVSEKWRELTKTTIVEGYGLTEASPVVCCNPIDGTDKIGTIGLPFPSTDVKIVDDKGNEVGPKEAGELIIQGPQVMLGYWNRPDETSKVIKENWLYTGDIATIDTQGFVKIVDRKKDMILVSGFNVYPNEVEDVIASHPGVLEVAVIGIPDAHSGEVVKAFVVKKDPQITEEEIILHTKKSLTSYKIPKSVEFRNELPKTNVGKILRRELRNS